MNVSDLYYQVEAVFDALWRELVLKSASTHLAVSTVLGVPTGRIALDCDYEFGGIKFKDMVRALYEQDVDEESVRAAWDEAVAIILANAPNAPSLVGQALRQVFPRFDFTAQGHPYFPCAQFLKLLSFNEGYALKITPTTCLIQTPSGRKIGIDRAAIFSSQGGTRTRRRITNFFTPLGVWRGRSTYAPTKRTTRGLYLILQRGLPEHGEVIDALFSIIVEAGKEVESALLGRADCYADLEATDQRANQYEGLTLEAFNIISSAKRNPVQALHRLFDGTMSKRQLEVAFGDPYATYGPVYTQAQKQKHLRALDRVITIRVVETGRTKPSEKPAETDNLLSTLFGI